MRSDYPKLDHFFGAYLNQDYELSSSHGRTHAAPSRKRHLPMIPLVWMRRTAVEQRLTRLPRALLVSTLCTLLALSGTMLFFWPAEKPGHRHTRTRAQLFFL